MANPNTSNRGFASMDEDKQREIARKGGESVPDEKRSFSRDHELAAEAGRRGGEVSGGNFAQDRERASEAGRRGGERLRLPGRAHSHALKHLLQAEGIPPWERRLLPLVWDTGGELLAAGDLLPGARLDDWLRRNGATLRWERAA